MPARHSPRRQLRPQAPGRRRTAVWQRAQEAYRARTAFGRSEVLRIGHRILHRGHRSGSEERLRVPASRICALLSGRLRAWPFPISTIPLTLQPHNSRAYAMRASALASSGRTDEAIADVKQAIQRDPRNAENYLLRANFAPANRPGAGSAERLWPSHPTGPGFRRRIWGAPRFCARTGRCSNRWPTATRPSS